MYQSSPSAQPCYRPPNKNTRSPIPFYRASAGQTAIAEVSVVPPAVPNCRGSLRQRRRRCRPVIMADTRRARSPCKILVQLAVHQKNGKYPMILFPVCDPVYV